MLAAGPSTLIPGAFRLGPSTLTPESAGAGTGHGGGGAGNGSACARPRSHANGSGAHRTHESCLHSGLLQLHQSPSIGTPTTGADVLVRTAALPRRDEDDQ